MRFVSPGTALAILLTGLLSAPAAAQQTATSAEIEGVGSAVEPLAAAQVDDPWSVLDDKLSRKKTGRILSRPGADKAPAVLAARSGTPDRSWTRTIGALAGVVGLIVFLAWGYRAMASGNLSLLGKARRPGLIEVVSKTSLSARQSLCLVRIGPRLVLIGQSPETLRALDVIDDADLAAKLVGEAARKRTGSSQAEFHDCLEREARDYRTNDDSISETITPEAPRIADVRQTLTNTIRRIRRAVAQT